MAAAAPELNEDVIVEILLRLPPDEPARLFRASLVCKPWRRVLSDPAFLRRYRRFHRTPPLLGFFDDGNLSPAFFSVAEASPFSKTAFDCSPLYSVLDSRHGRVLVRQGFAQNLLVRDPIAGVREELPEPHLPCGSAVVLCAAAGCDHCDCRGGPFLVVCAATNTNHIDDSVDASVYSSQVGAWKPSVSLHLGVDVKYPYDRVKRRSGAFVGDGVYFVLALRAGKKILKYDLGSHCLSTIDLPAGLEYCWDDVVLMPAEDGLLGLASTSTRASGLYLWSRMVNGDGVAGWVQRRVIELRAVLPVTIPNNKVMMKVIGYAEGVNVIFVGVISLGTFIINLESGVARKVTKPVYSPVLPFVSFYTPDYACRKLPLPAETNYSLRRYLANLQIHHRMLQG